MTKSAAITPMNRLFNRLRQRIKEAKAQIDSLETQVEIWEQAEAELVKRHSDSTLQFVLKFYDAEFVGDESEEPIEEEEQEKLGPTAAVRQIFASPDTSLTALEVRDILEDMRQQGVLETKAEVINSDITHSILRGLLEQKFIVKQGTLIDNRHAYVLCRAKEE